MYNGRYSTGWATNLREAIPPTITIANRGWANAPITLRTPIVDTTTTAYRLPALSSKLPCSLSVASYSPATHNKIHTTFRTSCKSAKLLIRRIVWTPYWVWKSVLPISKHLEIQCGVMYLNVGKPSYVLLHRKNSSPSAEGIYPVGVFWMICIEADGKRRRRQTTLYLCLPHSPTPSRTATYWMPIFVTTGLTVSVKTPNIG